MSALILATLICIETPAYEQYKDECETSAISQELHESMYGPKCKAAADLMVCGDAGGGEAWG